MEALQPRPDFVQQIPIEGFEVPNVKDDAMPLGNGPVKEGLGPDDLKQCITFPSCVVEPLQPLVSNDGNSLGSRHISSGANWEFVRVVDLPVAVEQGRFSTQS